jgi:macrolide-specific efflux system membrane fusion protein
MDIRAPFDAAALKNRIQTAPQTMRRLGGGLWLRLKQASTTVGRKAGGLWARFKGAPRRWQIVIGGSAFLVLVLIGVLMFPSVGADRAAIVTAPVTRGNIEDTVLATGVLQPARLVSVGAQVSGQVRRLYVALGQRVEAGAPIAEIDATTQQNNIRTAQAALRSQRAQRSARAANLQQAELQLRRQRELLAADAVSRADYESAEASALALRAEVASLEAQIQQAQLALSTANVNLGYTRITAPMAGTVVAIVTEEGQTVNANQQAPTIVKIAQLGTMTVSAQISEADVTRVRAGQQVYFTTLGETQTRHYARLRAIEPAPESIASDTAASSSAVYYNGLFDVDNSDGALRPGMTAQVFVVLASVRDALTIPAAALGARARDGRYAVQVVSSSGRVETRQVHVGLNNNVTAQVLGGLREGESVVVAQSDGESALVSSQSRRGGSGMFGAPGGRGPP